jgi:hypothetical protein
MSAPRFPETFSVNGDPLVIVQVDLLTTRPRQSVKVTFRGASVHYSLEVDSWEIARTNLNRLVLANLFHRASDLSLAARRLVLRSATPTEVNIETPSGFSEGSADHGQ